MKRSKSITETPLKLTQKIESQGFSAKSRPIRHFLLAKANKTIDRMLDSNGHTLRVSHARAGFKARIVCHDLPMLINSTRVIQLMNQQTIIYITKGNERKMIWSKHISTTLELISNKARVNDENHPSRIRFNEGMKVGTNRDDSRNGVRPITQDASQVTPPPNYPWQTNKDSNECSQFIHSSNPTTDQFSTILIF